MGPFLTNTPETRQPNQMRTQQYYLDPSGTTGYHLRDQGAKNNQIFIFTTPARKGNPPENIRAWYMAFTTFPAAKGKYVHPYFWFQNDHASSTKGFSVGEDDDYTQHDLPSQYHTSIDTWSQ